MSNGRSQPFGLFERMLAGRYLRAKRQHGGVALISVISVVAITLAVMALMEATFTLPGIAGMVLTVGIAVDANVLIVERFREERAKGLPFKKALNAAYDRVFTTILDSNITTLITCVILGYVSSEEVKGFAIVLGIGLATSMFTALVVTRLVFNTLISNNLLSDLRMVKLMDKPNIDWMKLRGSFWAFSGGCVVVGMGLFLYMR
ncbi:MAG TPA: protein translocase subunit SecDF, partial [Hyphomonadaceae bacterium]|nr:protein translocase subunit SecDF [Hyphomonadaceae bacterium]